MAKLKRLSDYQGEEALDLWLDLLEPLTVILGDGKASAAIASKKPIMLVVKDILKEHKKEAVEVLLRIDSTPINGANIVSRMVENISDILKSSEAGSFFGFAEPESAGEKSFGSATENTEADAK